MRFKRYKRYRRGRSTNVIRMKFQSFMDISTNSSSMQVITISAGGKEIMKRLAPQFSAYKYWKLGSISAKLVPASTLPVDPTGLSYASGEQTVDPRDQLTPGMMRITNGEDIFENISGLSDAQQHAIYNNMLLDPRWFKWMLQSGTSRRATPRYWTIGQLHQDKYPGATVNVPRIQAVSEEDVRLIGTGQEHRIMTGSSSTPTYEYGSSPYGFFQTGHKGVLGWLPTDGLTNIVHGYEDDEDFPTLASPVEIEVMKILLPKAYKTRYYYRLFITEEVLFKEPIVNFGIGGTSDMYRPLDVFHTPGVPVPRMPYEVDPNNGFPSDGSTGGNYGSD